MDLSFNNVYKFPLWGMRIIGAHPGIPKNLKWFSKFLIMHGICTGLFLIFSYNVIYHDLKAKNFAQTCKNGTFMMIYIAVTFNYFVFLWKASYLRKILKIVEDDYNNAKNWSVQDQNIFSKYSKSVAFVSKLWLFISYSGVYIFPIKNIALHVYHYCIGNFHKIQLFEIVIPTMSEETKNHIVTFTLIYSFLMIDATYCGTIFVAFSPLGPNLMLHACGLLEILTKRIDDIFTVDDINEEFRSIVIELQRIYGYIEEIQNTFRVPYELILKITIVIMPITAYGVIEAFKEGDVSVDFFAFIFGAIVYVSTPCYFSDMLLEKGETLRLAVYSCGWERTYQRRTRQMIALLIQRTSRPTAIATMFSVLRLEALTDVFHQAYAIFNLMNAMWQ